MIASPSAVAVLLCACCLAGAALAAPPPDAELSSAAASSPPAPTSATRSAETEQMVLLLRGIERRAGERSNPFANGARADHLARVEKVAGENRLQIKAQLGHQSLLAGRTERAIAEFGYLRELFRRAGARVPRQTLDETERLLAISYLRLGEQENCIAHHTIDSCLLPIRGQGVHRERRGSRQAIELLQSVLESRPGDLGSRWLLNIAYQTLGEYPQGVPSRWLIPPQVFEDDHEIPRFLDVAPRLGLDVRELSGGSVIEDLDGDGHLDIMASSWGAGDQLRFFRNDGRGGFVEATRAAGLTGLFGGLNLVHADYDNDGHTDVLVLRGAWLGKNGTHPNSLLRNNGDGSFTDVTRSAGLLSFHPTQTAAWGDFDNDGWLDLFIGNETVKGDRHPAELYVNNGDGTFREAAAEAGLDVVAFVKGVAWGDFDNDGRLDLYVSSIRQPNLLFHNDGPDEDGKWRFSEVAAAAGVSRPVDSFPTWFFDYDNDGWLDIFVSGYSLDRYGQIAADAAADYLGLESRGAKPSLYRNNGDGTFTDVAPALGLDEALYTMGCNFGDLDNDGFLDFYLGTGEPDFRGLVPNKMFRNDGGRRFQDVTTSGGFGHLQKGHGISFGDLDNDGDQDIYAVMGGSHDGDVFQNALFENPGSENRWVTLELRGVEANRSAIGARIRVVVRTAEGRRAIHATVSTGGSFGASSLRQEIGLGQALAIESVEVRWPGSGKSQRFDSVPLERIVRLTEGQPGVVELELRPVDLAGSGAASTGG